MNFQVEGRQRQSDDIHYFRISRFYELLFAW